MDFTYWISIGRNTRNGGTLSDFDWASFKSQLRSLLLSYGGEIVATVDGASEWENVPEETALVLVIVPEDATRSGIRAHLQRIGQRYHQEAIGLVGGAGTDTLVDCN